MKRADQVKFIGPVLSAGLAVAVLLGIILWRETCHKGIVREKEAAVAALEESISRTQSELEDAGRMLKEASSEQSDLRISNRSLEDRILNLEAQRNHLRADNETRSKHVRSLETAIKSLEQELSEASHKVLELESLPAKLEADLTVARNSLDHLESRLDEQSRLLSRAPMQYGFAGSSADKTVFALEGALGPQQALPWLVYVCNRDGIILEGNIHRAGDDHLIGHVMNWHQAASALVKGEKVFILPKKHHEKHH